MITFVDLETTGLEPRVGHILELGVVITDDFLVELDRRSWLVEPRVGRDPSLWHMSSYVSEMHLASGLVQDVMRDGRPVVDVQAEACEWIGDTHAGSMALMAGNSIHFDRSWIKLHMPRLDEAFGYRMVDVSSIKELVGRWWPGREYKIEGDKPHRALPDIEHSIRELRYYATEFMGGSW